MDRMRMAQANGKFQAREARVSGHGWWVDSSCSLVTLAIAKLHRILKGKTQLAKARNGKSVHWLAT